MVEVIKNFYKLSDKKSYLVGEKAEFDTKTEKRLESEGLVKILKTKK